MGLIEGYLKSERHLASRIMMWLAFSKKRFDVCQIHSIVRPDEAEAEAFIHEKQLEAPDRCTKSRPLTRD
jgi:hypothetical protein